MIKLKKGVLISALSCLGVTCLLCILGIFGVAIFSGVGLRILLIFASLTVALSASLSDINIFEKNKKIAIASLSLLGISLVFALIIFCSKLLDEVHVFNKITAILSVFSIMFMIIVSLYTKLENKFRVLQAITYIVVLLVDILISLLIAGVNILSVKGMTEIFGVLCVVAVGLLIATAVVSTKKENATEPGETQGFIRVKKVEYENLLKENKALKEEIAMLRSEKK